MTTVNTDSNGTAYASHFESAEHEYKTSKEGVWLFLATEILMFGGLFVAYAIFKNLYPDIFLEGSRSLNKWLGGFNTVVLLTSSLTMALSINYLQSGDRRKAQINLWLTLLCACCFMVVKYFEYQHKIHVGTLPNNFFNAELLTEGIPKNVAMFYGLYFVMTGLHGLHVLVGMGLIYWLILRNKRGDFTPYKYTAVEGVGLYWHLVDLIWIYLFPLMYLVT